MLPWDVMQNTIGIVAGVLNTMHAVVCATVGRCAIGMQYVWHEIRCF